MAAPEENLARFAAAEIGRLTGRETHVLAGGTGAWRGAGMPIETGQERWADAPDDVWYKPYDNKSGVEQAMQNYLSWEVALVAQIERDGDARFRKG